MKATLTCLALALPLAAVCADDIQFAVINGIDSIHRIHTRSSLYPWEHEKPDEIVVSLGCGFAEAEYRRAATPVSTVDDEPDTRLWKVIVPLGHYCKLGEYVLDGWHVVAFRIWKGKNYLINFADLKVGEHGRLYVDDPRFIENSGLRAVASTGEQTDDTSEDRVYVEAIPMRSSKP